MEDMDDDNDDEVTPFLEIGKGRFTADRRQLAGLMLVLGTCAAFQPLTNIASLIGVDDDLEGGENFDGGNSAIENASLASGLVQLIFGVLAMAVGYLCLVHDYSNYRLTGVLILLTQLAWMPFITGMVEIGEASSGPYTIGTRRTVTNGTVVLEEFVVNPFIPEDYLPSERDVKFFGAMGILGILSYGTGFLGSLAFTEFALYAFDVGKPTHRGARYYRGRLLFYSFVMVIAGISQLLLGSYVLFNFGGGPLVPSVVVAMYRVYYPEITVTMGCVQVTLGYYGIGRYLSYVPVGFNDHQFQIMIFVGWLLQLVLQYIVQISYSPSDEKDTSLLPTLALLSLGLYIILAFLDFKMRTTPFFLTNEYYGMRSDKNMKDDGYTEAMVPRSDNEEQELLVVADNQKGGDYETLIDTPEDNGVAILSTPMGQNERDNDIDEMGNSLEPPVEDTATSVDRQASQLLFVDEESALQNVEDDGVHDQNYHGESGADRRVSSDPPVVPAAMASFDHDDDGNDDDADNDPPIVVEEIVEIDGIVVERTVEYPAAYRGSSELADFDDAPDDVTPPQSNKSFETDMEDTWGRTRTPTHLPTLMEEGGDRQEDSASAMFEGDDDPSNLDRYVPADLDEHNARDGDDDDDRAMIRAGEERRPTAAAATSLVRSTPDDPSATYDGYNSDEYPEISEASPDDDTVALQAKIDRLRKEVIADTMETYLSEIL